MVTDGPIPTPGLLDRSPGPCKRIRINISGRVVETYPEILARYPDTLLGNTRTRHQFWDPVRKEYFLDVCMPTFEAIYQFYQSGYLRKPLEVPMATFLEQMEYFQLGTDVIRSYKQMEGILPDEEEMDLPPEGKRRDLWKLFEYPGSSRAAKLLAIFSVLFIVVSVFTLCIETLPVFKGRDCRKVAIENPGNDSWSGSSDTSNTTRYKLVPNLRNEFFLVEAICVAWFTVEVAVRLYSCPSRRRFFFSILNVVDFATIVPFYITLALMVQHDDCSFGRKSAAISFMRILRVFRIFKLSKHSKSLQIWMAALRASRDEFFLFLFFVSMTSLVFASVIYYAERGAVDSQIKHIPEGIWWAVATITTLGYGDVVPVTRAGKATGAVCVVAGILVIALPTPIIINNFNKFYKNETGRGYEQDLTNERNR